MCVGGGVGVGGAGGALRCWWGARFSAGAELMKSPGVNDCGSSLRANSSFTMRPGTEQRAQM